jgi:hypothetical protein
MPLRHRHAYAADLQRGLPSGSCLPPRKFPARNEGAGAHRFQPRSVRFELAPNQGGVPHRFLAYSFPSRLPDPAHLTVLNRPGFVRAAPALPGTTRIRLPSTPPPCCDRAAVKVSHLHSNPSASRRMLSRPGARCRDCSRSVSPSRSPNPPYRSLGNGLSTVSAVRRGSWSARGMGSCCPGRRNGRPSPSRSGRTRPRPPRYATSRRGW